MHVFLCQNPDFDSGDKVPCEEEDEVEMKKKRAVVEEADAENQEKEMVKI